MGRKKLSENEKKSNKNKEEVEENSIFMNLSGDVKRSIVAIILFALAILFILGFFHSAGSFGEFLNKMIAYSIGWVKFIFPIFLIVFGVALLLRRETAFYVTKLIGLAMALLSFTGIFHWFYENSEMLLMAKVGKGGGYVGYFFAYFLGKYLGQAGSLVVLLALLFLGIILAFNFSIMHFLLRFKKEKEKNNPEEKNDNIDMKIELPSENISTNDSNEKQEIEEKKIEENIGKIEFVEGRDQFVSLEIDNQNEISENFTRRKMIKKKKMDLDSQGNEEYFFENKKDSKWIFPTPELLEKSFGKADGGDIEENFVIIEKTLRDFGIDVTRGGTKTGPSVTQYSFRPAVGVKISKILSLQNDLSLALARTIRIEAPIPGQSLIGIEIPNSDSLIVRLRDMIEEAQFKKRKSDLTLALGKDVSGSCIFGDLAKMPHLMIAGATGTGKSVCINSVITTLLYQNSPEDLKFIMVDPKRVELSLYNGVPHLLTDVIVENSKVVNVLKWAVGEMERRYRILQETASRDLNSYKEKIKLGQKRTYTDPESGEITEEKLEKLPYIVIVIDELADLMGTHRKEVEGAIVRIAQMARAVGIHLIVSTQRPSVEVITGLIKANITTRIAFQVATQIDSRTILDMGGAEKLLGNGDMLFLSSSSPKPKRIQGVFISEDEVKKIVEFVKKQRVEKEEVEESVFEKETQKEISDYKEDELASGEDSELLKSAKEEILRSKKASASFLQRRLRIGYARAARLLDMLEEEGIIGPSNGAKPREIYGIEEKQDIGYNDSSEDQEKRDKWQI